ncbi:endonuclease [Abyssalbus ytuae]|uniref:Endonuclease n=1 Tax=Abyssalbus ytuae TaxID=2926907 RepID=A0A9E7CTC6_9FLAO|nr:endonuclease [Abyssalbus ytuae]UOB15927.1 endonuclease [Abyssalbus ytuae]
MKHFYFKEKDKTNIHTVAFYNLENLFDTENDPLTLDDDFTPRGFKNWNKKRYEKKLYKLGKAISSVGYHKAHKSPAVVGLAEIENKKVIQDLVNSRHLKEKDFDIIHYESPDERGIDTGFIYQKRHFEVLKSEVEPLLVYDELGVRDYTRDILHVTGVLNNEPVHILVNHWPSRRDGAELTSYKRIEAAKTVHQIIERVKAVEANPSFIIMGDFNDDPFSESIKQHLVTPELYNPMEKLLNPYKRGSLNHKFNWNLFDQIIFSTNFFDIEEDTHAFAHADIFDEKFLAEWKGKYKGNPFRTYAGRKYLGGYSDHFPVYIQLKKY